MATKKRMGQPPKPEGPKLTKQIRVHPSILEAVDDLAAKDRRSRSQWIQMAIEEKLRSSGVDPDALIEHAKRAGR